MAGRVLVAALAFSITLLSAGQAVAQGGGGFGGQGGGQFVSPPAASPAVELSEAECKPLRQTVTLPAPIAHARPEAEAKILAALNAKTEAEFVDTPLADAIKFLGDRWKISVRIDERALKEDGIALDEPLNFEAEGIPGHSLLSLTLRDSGMTWTIRRGVLLITTESAAEEMMDTRVYDVSDLVLRRDKKGLLRRDFTQLIETIQNTTSGPWKDIDGDGGSVSELSMQDINSLAITQTLDLHRQIGRLLAELRQARHDLLPAATTTARLTPAVTEPPSSGPFGAGATTTPQPVRAEPTTAERPRPKLPLIDELEQQIRAALTKQIAIDFVDTPLTDALVHIADQIGTQIQLDTKALEEDGIANDGPISLKSASRPAGDILGDVLEPLNCEWTILHDTLFVTTEVEGEGIQTTRVYDVADLVVQLDAKGRPERDFGALSDLLQNETSGPWEEIDGNGGTINEFEALRINALAIRQTHGNHAQIAALLAQLRSHKHDALPRGLDASPRGTGTSGASFGGGSGGGLSGGGFGGGSFGGAGFGGGSSATGGVLFRPGLPTAGKDGAVKPKAGTP